MTLARFAVRTLLWLPPAFAAWWALAPWQAETAGWIARACVRLLERGLLEAVERTGSVLVFVTTVQSNMAGREGVLAPEVNALVFGYGLPVFVALMLATRGSAAKMALGAVALLVLQGVGIALGFLAQLVAAGPGPAGAAGLGSWGIEAVVITYQLFSLVIPGVAPILLWAALERATIAGFVAPPPCETSPA